MAQPIRGMRPPRNYPVAENAREIRVKSTRYLDATGTMLPELPADSTSTPEEAAIMVSKMRVLPLDMGLMPPRELVEKNRDFCNEMEESDENKRLNLTACEAFLNQALEQS